MCEEFRNHVAQVLVVVALLGRRSLARWWLFVQHGSYMFIVYVVSCICMVLVPVVISVRLTTYVPPITSVHLYWHAAVWMVSCAAGPV